MFVVVWRFTANDPAAFEEHYGPEGTWARLFRRSPEYVRTDLLRGSDAYLTLDWWTSLAAYNAHPDVNGLWACRGCLKEGYPSVEAFEEEQAQVSDELGELGGLGGDDDV